MFLFECLSRSKYFSQNIAYILFVLFSTGIKASNSEVDISINESFEKKCELFTKGVLTKQQTCKEALQAYIPEIADLSKTSLDALNDSFSGPTLRKNRSCLASVLQLIIALHNPSLLFSYDHFLQTLQTSMHRYSKHHYTDGVSQSFCSFVRCMLTLSSSLALLQTVRDHSENDISLIYEYLSLNTEEGPSESRQKSPEKQREGETADLPMILRTTPAHSSSPSFFNKKSSCKNLIKDLLSLPIQTQTVAPKTQGHTTHADLTNTLDQAMLMLQNQRSEDLRTVYARRQKKSLEDRAPRRQRPQPYYIPTPTFAPADIVSYRRPPGEHLFEAHRSLTQTAPSHLSYGGLPAPTYTVTPSAHGPLQYMHTPSSMLPAYDSTYPHTTWQTNPYTSHSYYGLNFRHSQPPSFYPNTPPVQSIDSFDYPNNCPPTGIVSTGEEQQTLTTSGFYQPPPAW